MRAQLESDIAEGKQEFVPELTADQLANISKIKRPQLAEDVANIIDTIEDERF